MGQHWLINDTVPSVEFDDPPSVFCTGPGQPHTSAPVGGQWGGGLRGLRPAGLQERRPGRGESLSCGGESPSARSSEDAAGTKGGRRATEALSSDRLQLLMAAADLKASGISAVLTLSVP